jgi:NADPH:quinone reductase-like Zn-dependent oxidoreductase
MGAIKTEAWVLRAGPAGGPDEAAVPGNLELDEFSFPDISDDEVLVAPVYGCWEGNMTHGIERKPIDICHLRREERVVLGNSGVLQVLRTGRSITHLREGQYCLLAPFGKTDKQGYLELVHAYDAPGTVGLLAKVTKAPGRILFPIPEDSALSLIEWATYGRYWTAWDNWRVAYGCWQLQVNTTDYDEPPLVFAWGGGVALAELELARRAGFRTAMTTSHYSRFPALLSRGITPVDRSEFPGLDRDPDRYRTDDAYRQECRDSETRFLQRIRELSGGHGVSILIDNVGGPLYRTSLKMLGRQSVLSSVGWKTGMKLTSLRAVECIGRHLHVNTHGFRYTDIERIIQFQEQTRFIRTTAQGPIDVYAFDEIPELSKRYAAGAVDEYFPVFQVNDADNASIGTSK